MRHTGAGLAIPTFPTAFGRWIPPLESTPVAIHFAHRVGAVLVFFATALDGVRRLPRPRHALPPSRRRS